jgi:hypothetical protein
MLATRLSRKSREKSILQSQLLAYLHRGRLITKQTRRDDYQQKCQGRGADQAASSGRSTDRLLRRSQKGSIARKGKLHVGYALS